MNKRLLAALALVSGAVGLTACTKTEAPPAAAAPAPVAAALTAAAPAVLTAAPAEAAPAPAAVAAPAPAAAPGVLAVQGFGVAVPASWAAQPTSSSMRFAQFVIPAAGTAEGGEVAAFFFPTGNGGTHEMNIERWASQFTAADGSPAKPVVTVTKSGNTEVTLVELKGNYARGVGMGPEGQAGKPNQTLMVAMVEIPAGRITLQIYGPSKTVAAQRDNFLKVAHGFKPI